MTFGLALIGLSALLWLSACASRNKVDWKALPVYELVEKLDGLAPVWDNGRTSASIDVRVYLEPFQQSKYMGESLAYLVSRQDARLRIYDYPPYASSESFMVSGIGQCIAQVSPDLYLVYLKELTTTPERLADELVMADIAKFVLGERYDRKCLQEKIEALKKIFENDNPLNLVERPATLINGRLVYGDLTLAEWQDLLAQARAE